MIPVLMFDAVVLFANAARNVITSGRDYIAPTGACDAGDSIPWPLGKYIVGEMKKVGKAL